jgi:hypothetical protein
MSIPEVKKSWAHVVNPAAGRDVVAVIDIYTENTQAAVEPKQEMVKRPTTFKQDVDPEAFKIAEQFYKTHYEEITKTTKRNDLEKIFHHYHPNPVIEFPVVLYAMAKGMKVVNVFDRGSCLEWHKTNPATINRAKRLFKKPSQTSDGWTHMGTPCAQTETISPQPFEQEIKNEQPHPIQASENLTLDEIVEKIGSIKAEISHLDSEIGSLLNFHTEHLNEIQRVDEIKDKELGVFLKSFHQKMIVELERVLDTIQAEINSKKEIQANYCDMLKQ